VVYLENSLEGKALAWIDSLRKSHFKAELFLGESKPKKAFSYAEKKGHKGILILGEDERNSDSVNIKNFKSRSEQKFSMNDLTSLKGFLS
jgi:histidyl-tRNA synthetase